MYEYQPASPDIVARVSALEAVCARHDVPLVAVALQIPGAFWAELRAEGPVRPDAPLPVTA